MSTKEIILHIGTHKTGTTSLQQFLLSNKYLLNNFDVDFFSGRFISSNHIELHVSSMHPDRMSPMKHLRGLLPTEAFVYETKLAVKNFINSSPYKKLVFSAEGLSYLRQPSELEKLKNIFVGADVKVVVILRDKKEFLRSYSHTIRKMGFQPTEDRYSFLYVEPDSWLVDYDCLVGCYQASFGKENMIVKNYEEEIKLYGSIIPSFLNLIGLPNYIYSKNEEFWLNRSIY